jgi:tRNA-dihydrouridine synthase
MPGKRTGISYPGDIKTKSKLPIIGNGDISTARQAVRRVRDYGVDAVTDQARRFEIPLFLNRLTRSGGAGLSGCQLHKALRGS